MNLAKLFEVQKAFREKVGYNGEDRFNKLVLALLVEIGECANCWRGFKYWSKNQKPMIHAARAPYMDIEDADFYNPLLEEFVDGLAFILEIGLETYSYFDVKLPIAFSEIDTKPLKHESVTKQFNELFSSVTYLDDCVGDRKFSVAMETEAQYQFLVREYIGLGEMLGFTWEQIEQAYYAKMQINHQRQATGY